jgi:hypothetical protein
MRRFLSVVVGFVVFFALSMLAGQLLGSVKCRDGWASSSIGRQGACSHHGGVDRSRGGLGMIFMVVGGFAGFLFYGSAIGERLDKPRQRPPLPPRPPTPASPPSPLASSEPFEPEPHTPRPPKPVIPPRPGAKACPKCGGAMKLRTARSGYYAGRKFWGCLRYPDCTGTTNVKRR